jgi:hypothetical protein
MMACPNHLGSRRVKKSGLRALVLLIGIKTRHLLFSFLITVAGSGRLQRQN